MAVGIERFGFDLQFHAGKTAAGKFFLAASRLRAIDDQICVMNEAAFTRMDFDGLIQRVVAIGGRKIKFQ